MVTRAQTNQGDGDEDVASPDIYSNVFRILVTSVTQAMKTFIANETAPVPVTPKTITYSSTIDPYDKNSFETKTKKGKYR